MSKFWFRIAISALSVVLALGCQPTSSPPAGAVDGLAVIATTGMIADTARRIVGDRGRVEALMGPGVDPHLFKASESDVQRLAEAELILYNGLHLEGKMGDILGKLGSSRAVVAVAEAIPAAELRSPPEFQGQHDPHVWFDVRLWARTIEPVVAALSRLDPAGAATYRANGEAYARELSELDAWVESRIAEIPPAQRVLVTAHDAFGYFGRRYGLEVVGLQGISTVAEAGLQDVSRVVDLVAGRKIRSIFVESSVSSRSIEAVRAACRSRGWDVSIGGQLYSDAMGAAGTTAGTYPGMVRANVDTLVQALK